MMVVNFGTLHTSRSNGKLNCMSQLEPQELVSLFADFQSIESASGGH